MSRRGLTLVEILVAVVVLEVGLLGVVGTLLLAARDLAAARETERITTALEGTYDSLAAAGVPGSAGERPMGGGARLAWRIDGAGGVEVTWWRDSTRVAEVFGGRFDGAGGTAGGGGLPR